MLCSHWAPARLFAAESFLALKAASSRDICALRPMRGMVALPLLDLVQREPPQPRHIPRVSLADARQRRRDNEKLVAAGVDPSEQRKATSASRKSQALAKELRAAGKPQLGTFEQVAREWLTNIQAAKVSAAHAERTRIRLEQDIFPWLGASQIAQIEAPQLLEALRRVEGRGAIETAHRIKDSCSQVFRYAIASGVCGRTPAADLRDALRPIESKHHAAIVDPKLAGALLRDIDECRGNPVTRAALALSALLLLRPGELRQLE